MRYQVPRLKISASRAEELRFQGLGGQVSRMRRSDSQDEEDKMPRMKRSAFQDEKISFPG